MRRARLRTVSVPVTDTGWDIEIIESTLRQVVPQLAYPVPDFHNPTGCLMPVHERVRILRAAQRSGAWLVVIDETLAEHIPQWTWQLPAGGLSLWVDLGEPSASALAERALDNGVRIESGAYFATDPGIFEQRLRIPYTTPPDTLREAVHRMATALADGLSLSSTTRRPHWVA